MKEFFFDTPKGLFLVSNPFGIIKTILKIAIKNGQKRPPDLAPSPVAQHITPA
jgi:hypothetical protein